MTTKNKTLFFVSFFVVCFHLFSLHYLKEWKWQNKKNTWVKKENAKTKQQKALSLFIEEALFEDISFSNDMLYSISHEKPYALSDLSPIKENFIFPTSYPLNSSIYMEGLIDQSILRLTALPLINVEVPLEIIESEKQDILISNPSFDISYLKFPDSFEKIDSLPVLHEEKLESQEKRRSNIPFINSNHFTYNIEYIPKKEGVGYLFKIILLPIEDLTSFRMKQHFTFVINEVLQFDSHFQNVLKKSLKHLHSDDTFSFLYIDSLMALKGELFQKNDERLNSLILLGDFKLTPEIIKECTKLNEGRASIYAISSEDQSLLTSLNRGFTIINQNKEDLYSSLPQLFKKIEHAIGHSLSLASQKSKSGQGIEIFPQKARLSCLKIDQPFFLYGEIDKLEDFHLIIQGKNQHRWFDIKKTISFANATKVSSDEFLNNWIKEKAHDYYLHYFKTNKESYIIKAKELVTSL